MKPIVSTPSCLIRPTLGLMLLALADVARAQSASAEAAPAVSLSTLVSEITAKNPERQFYQEEIAAAREKNFDYRMRLVELEQQGFAVSLARNERYPSISVSPYLSRENGGDRQTIVGLGLSVPLPISGRTGAAVEVANARRRQAETAVLVAQRNMEREVITAIHRLGAKLAESAKWTPDAAHRFREAADLADRHYRLGAVPISTYVELQNSYLDAIEALYETQQEALEAAGTLRLLTGLEINLVTTSTQ